MALCRTNQINGALDGATDNPGAATTGPVAPSSALDAGHPTHPTTRAPSSATGWPASSASLLGRARRHATALYRTLHDPRIPRYARWPLMGLLAFGMLPIPGPVDELALGLVVAVVAWRWPHIYREHRNALDRAAASPSPETRKARKATVVVIPVAALSNAPDSTATVGRPA